MTTSHIAAVEEAERVRRQEQALMAEMETLLKAAASDPFWLARYYREKWLDAIFDDTGNRRPRMGDLDPLGDEPGNG